MPRKGRPPRTHALREMLEARKHTLVTRLWDDIRNASDEGSRDVLDTDESGGTICEDDLRYALLSMKARGIAHIEDALTRLERGRYGRCRDCGRAIAEQRLQAMPFAVRCRPCEDKREQAAARERRRGARPAYVL